MGEAPVRSWQEMRRWQIGLLERSTGRPLEQWNAEVAAADPADEAALRAWLEERGVRGYAQMLLVHERFGYPDFLLRSAEELVEGQYADRPALRPVHDLILASLPGIGASEAIVQARKTYVSLLTPRRTFARIAATTRSRVDLALRWEDAPPSPRLAPASARMGSGMTVMTGLREPADVDQEVLGWLAAAYRENC